ncbi:MAG: hypothetical protein ACRD96_03085, partial [Bryobacteraceae bacterium]
MLIVRGISLAAVAAVVFAIFAPRPVAPVRGLAALRVPPGFTVERAAGPDLVSYGMMAAFD